MGADPGDENVVAILLGSLPNSYDPYLATLTVTSSLLSTTLTKSISVVSATKLIGVPFEIGPRKMTARKWRSAPTSRQTAEVERRRGPMWSVTTAIRRDI
jgi:hypothetical protein